MRFIRQRLAALLFLALGVTACSGGGSTPGTTGGTSSPTPSPGPTGSSDPPGSGNVTGRVLDLSSYDANLTAGGGVGWSVLPNGSAATGVNPVGGAIVVIGPALIAGASVPASLPAGDIATIANANGAFALTTTATGTQYLMVFPGAGDHVHMAAIHRSIVLSAGDNAVPTLLMAAVTSDEASWLTQVNADRAANGVAPLVFDESLMESARYWANYMGTTGYFNHCIPASCSGSPPAGTPAQDATPQSRDDYFHAMIGGWGENIAAGYSTWSSAEAAFMAEKANCPGDTASGCPFAENTGHFLNIVNAGYQWVGLGEALVGASPYYSYYDQEFAIPGAAATSADARREFRMSSPLSPQR